MRECNSGTPKGIDDLGPERGRQGCMLVDDDGAHDKGRSAIAMLRMPTNRAVRHWS